MSLVFTSDFLDELERRYDNRRSWEQPDVYFLATSPERATEREWIEHQVAELDSDARAKVIPKLRSDDHWVATFHELSVLAVLRDAWLEPTYESILAGTDLTPDILIEGAGRGVAVEVWTRRVSDRKRKEQVGWRELCGRLSPIPSGLGLRVEATERDTVIAPPTASRAKQLERELSVWLLGAGTSVGALYEHPPYRFVVAGTIPSVRTLLVPPRRGGSVSTDDVLDGIRDKVRRYAPALRVADRSLVVAVAAETVPIDMELIRAALRGSQSTSVTFGPFDSGLLADHSVQLRKDDVPPRFDPTLAAVAWLSVPGPEPRLEVFANASARYPLELPTTDMMTPQIA